MIDLELSAENRLVRDTARAFAEAEILPHIREWDERHEVMAQLGYVAQRYEKQFGFGFVMFVGETNASDVLATISDRLHNDFETERKVVRNELARINRTRLERMLGPEGGYYNW